jgi:hypothetical protein
MRADGAAKGEPEVLGPVSVDNGDVYLRVRPVWTAGQAADPGSDTPYELTVEWGPPRPDWELEPNDTPETANAIDPDVGMRGRLRGAEDEDWYRVKVPPGYRLDVRVMGVDGIDLVVFVGAERRQVDVGGFGGDETFEAMPDRDGQVVFAVSEHMVARKLGKRAPPVPQREQPYTVQIKLRPADGRR